MIETQSEFILKRIASLLLYESVFNNEVGEAFLKILETLDKGDRDPNAIGVDIRQGQKCYTRDCLQAYGNWFKVLAAQNRSWQDYLIKQILENDNPFSQQVQKTAISDLPPSLIAATKYDLQVLEIIYNWDIQHLSKWVKEVANLPVAPVTWYCETCSKTFLHQTKNWANAIEDLACYYRQNGTGIFAIYDALRWEKGELRGIVRADRVDLEEIVGYESQKNALIKNTECLLGGYPALHVLLYGSRGSGKSSLVKGLLQKYSDRGLRLIEVDKLHLNDLPKIVEQLPELPQKFIIFVDDLSFEEDDDSFKALKVVLEGSLTARGKNVVVYATSNRRHLIKEFFEDRPPPKDGDEIHAWDTVQEKLSFSDRFGLTLTFEPANQEKYLKIVTHLATRAKIKIDSSLLEFGAKQWATRHNGRSGRSARQFIDFLIGELGSPKINSES
ncbi:MAG: ATP-binding protein [Prochloraceae cyanobacterium]|nr:ATP-binding protein [Prochloraceae cyanobacterium]